MGRRSIKRLPSRRLPIERILLVGFILFVTYRILTPSSTVVATVTAPNGTGTAELRKIYYVAQPSYKIYYRPEGAFFPQGLLSLSAYTNVPHQTAEESLEWSPDSRYLLFKINDQPIWSYDFQSEAGKTPESSTNAGD
jgi:hypothetical protein